MKRRDPLWMRDPVGLPRKRACVLVPLLTVLLGTAGFCEESGQPRKEDRTVELSDAEVENIVRRSYQYVAMYNVNNKFAIKQGGWNTVDCDTKLKDHTMREIARPNNDTLYISCMLDLRKDPVILEMPAFDSKYVSLMVTGYDHYVNVPMTTRLGDFKKPEKMLFYTKRTEGYRGEPVEGVDHENCALPQQGQSNYLTTCEHPSTRYSCQGTADQRFRALCSGRRIRQPGDQPYGAVP